MRQLAGDQVGLVGLGDSDDQVGGFDAGFGEHRRKGSVASHRAHVETVGELTEGRRVEVDQGDVVGFRNQRFVETGADRIELRRRSVAVSSSLRWATST